jgi:hypothetical protein
MGSQFTNKLTCVEFNKAWQIGFAKEAWLVDCQTKPLFIHQIIELLSPLKIHGYLDAKPLKTTPFEKRTCNYFLTSIFLDLTV